MDTNQNNISSTKIAGFGACMIGGYPHESGGLFEIACGLVEKTLSLPVQSRVSTLGGFSAPRAEKYLKLRILSCNPDYVVIQFGSTDASCPIQSKHRLTENSFQSGVSHARNSPINRPSTVTIARWRLQSLVARFRKPDPVTSLSSYVAAIKHMVDDCILAQVTPIVLSPFIFGASYSTENAIKYTNALRYVFSKMNQVIFIDCVQLLSKFPNSKVLLSDGFHLSRFGHNLIGEAIAQAVVADIRAKIELSSRPVSAAQ